jgi:hypothetical protein
MVQTLLNSIRRTFMYRMIRVSTLELQNKEILDNLKNQGFSWIRRYNRSFEHIVRDPTIGCIVELYTCRYPGCIPLNSPKANKLIHRVCYF